MINLLRTDLYRIGKSKSFRITSIASVVAVIPILLIFFITNSSLNIMSVGESNGFYIGANKISEAGLSVIRSTLGFTILIFIATLFILSDVVVIRYKNGTIKNSLAYGEDRIKVYISNFIAIIIAMIALSTTVFAVAYIISSLAMFKTIFIDLYYIKMLLKAVLTIIIILVTIMAFYMMLGTIIKNSSVINLIGVLSWFIIPITMSNSILEGGKSKLPLMIIRDICGNPLNPSFQYGDFFSIVLVLLVSLGIGIWVFKKQDI